MEKARIRITDNYEQSLYEPHICHLCNDPPCVLACSTQALSQAENGLIHIDDQLCNGCQGCMEACPYQAIWWQEELGKPLVCDRCDGDPTCIQFCTIGALQLIEV
jgi:Fe-S-cluster-containing dehydrogenase component